MYSIVEDPPLESWKSVMNGFSQCSLWQSFEYGEVMEEAFPRTEVVRLLASNSKGEHVGALQGIYSRYLGFGMGVEVNNGPVINVTDDERSHVVESLLMALEDFGKKRKIIKGQIWWPESWGLLEVFYRLGYKSVSKFNGYAVTLNKTIEGLWKKIHRNKRKNIRKALREGVEIVETYDYDDLLTFYRMLEAAARRHDFAAAPLSWFKAIWKIYEPGQSSRIFLAEWKGRKISSVFTVAHGSTIYALAAGSLSEDWKVRPNDLLHWKVMEWACQRNFSTYYMGLVSDPIPTRGSKSWGIWRWKREWNGNLNALHIFEKTYIPKYRYIPEAKRLVEQSYMSLKRILGRFS